MMKPFSDWQHSSEVEVQVERVLQLFSLEDKIKLVSGQFIRSSHAKPPAGLPLFNLTDGPAGVRTAIDTTSATCATAMPAPIALAATWSPELAHKYGDVLGLEAKLTGHNVLLGPAVDIARAPLAGRTFESFGEDPLLQSRLIVPEVQAIQAHGVQACLKHFIVNNQEWDRNSIDVQVDQRTLHELYLPPFESAIKLGGVASVMASYNQINGEFACENTHLLSGILRDELGFRGWVMSDYLANHSTAKAANAGLEWELTMPQASQWREKLYESVQKNEVKLETLNEMVRRILRPTIGLGVLDSVNEQPIPIAEHAYVALEIAEQSIVLLKNTGGLLPLSSSISSIAVIGADANNVSAAGGGSALVQPIRAVSVLEGIRSRVGDHVRIEFEAGFDPVNGAVLLPGPAAIPSSVLVNEWQAQYWDNLGFEGAARLERLEPSIELNCGFLDLPDFRFCPTSSNLKPLELGLQFSARWIGIIKAPTSGTYALSVSLVGQARLYVQGRLQIEAKHHDVLVNQVQRQSNNNGIGWGGIGARVLTHELLFEANQEYEVMLEYVADASVFGFMYGAQLKLGWITPEDGFTPAMQAAVALAERSDVAVIVARTLETEAMDRPDLELPNFQTQLIRAVSAVNPKTIVLLMSGSSVAISGWENKVPAILETWYAGQEQGIAVARVLFGDINPSGKLPLSFPQSLSKMPPIEYPGTNGVLRYTEGLKVGYRGYDAYGIEPQYPFGFGLSYTSFTYSNLNIISFENTFLLRFDLENTGTRDGIEIAQVYLEPPTNADAPPKKLVGWSRISLRVGEKRTVVVTLDSLSLERPFSSWNGGWEIEYGEYGVIIGASSRDYRLRTSLLLVEDS